MLFKDYLKLKNLAEDSIKDYEHFLDRYMKYSFNSLNQEKINAYFLDIKEKKLSSSLFNSSISAINHYIEYLRIETKQDLKLNLPKPSKQLLKVKNFITQDVLLKEIFPLIDCIVKNPLKVKAILLFMFYTGIRLKEVSLLKREDINLDTNVFKVCETKIHKEENKIFVGGDKINIIRAYFQSEEQKINAFNVTKKGLSQIFYRISKHITNIKFHPHLLRHSFAMYLVKNKIPINYIQKLMGHSSIKTTEIYLTNNIDDIKEMIDDLNMKMNKIKVS